MTRGWLHIVRVSTRAFVAGWVLGIASLAWGAGRIVPVTAATPGALAAFERGRTLSENNREVEAIVAFQAAVKEDPRFAQALAQLGYHRQSAEGLIDLQNAVKLAKGLPEAERLWIELLLAKRQEDLPRAQALLRRLSALVPDDWHVAYEAGDVAYAERSWKRAADAYRQAMRQSRNCTVYNNLGYALAMGEEFSEALVSFRRCADLEPREPNPQDSLGEVHLALRRFDKAEETFRRAVELSPAFHSGWHGLAFTRFYQHDWSGGLERLKQAVAAAGRVNEQLELHLVAAWVELARDKGPEALALLDRVEKEGRALKADGRYGLAHAAVVRSALLTELGRYPEAIAAADVALERAGGSGLPGAMAGALRRRALLRRLIAEVKAARLPAAEATLRLFEAEADRVKGTSEGESGRHLARGMLARGRGDWRAASAELGQCRLFGLTEYTLDFRIKPEDPYCLWQQAEVLEKLDDKAGAAKLRDRLARGLTRDPVALYVWSRVTRP